VAVEVAALSGEREPAGLSPELEHAARIRKNTGMYPLRALMT
jgi:hypothetical protein